MIETVDTIERLAKQLLPLLSGHGPEIQGAVIASLLATWLAGCIPSRRDEILQQWLELVRELVPLRVN